MLCTPVLCSVLHFSWAYNPLEEQRTQSMASSTLSNMEPVPEPPPCLSACSAAAVDASSAANMAVHLPSLLSPLRPPHGDTVAKMMLMANRHDVAPTRICHKARLLGQEGNVEKSPPQEGAPPQSPTTIALAIEQRNNALACQFHCLNSHSFSPCA